MLVALAERSRHFVLHDGPREVRLPIEIVFYWIVKADELHPKGSMDCGTLGSFCRGRYEQGFSPGIPPFNTINKSILLLLGESSDGYFNFDLFPGLALGTDIFTPEKIVLVNLGATGESIWTQRKVYSFEDAGLADVIVANKDDMIWEVKRGFLDATKTLNVQPCDFHFMTVPVCQGG